MEIACSSTSGCSSLLTNIPSHSVVISMPFPPVPSLKNTYRVSYSSGAATLKAGVRLSPPLLLPRVPPPPLNFRNMAASILHNMLRGKARAESERASSQGSQQQLPELESDEDVSEEDVGDAFELPRQEEEEAELVEELQGLEEEAMTGEDDGREPNDYDRRAHIFDESSRVFQALKDRERPPPCS